MSIDPTDYELGQTGWNAPLEEEEPTPAWKMVGNIALGASFTIAFTASLATCTAKKRKISVIQQGDHQGPAVQVEIAEEEEKKSPLDRPAAASDEKKEQAQKTAPRANDTQHPQVVELFTTIATTVTLSLGKSWVSQLWQGDKNPVVKLRNLEAQLEKPPNPIHPFAFLLAAPKEQVQAILTENSSLKISGVIGGVQRGMERELKTNNIEPYIDDFAKSMNTTTEAIRPLIQARDWTKFVQHLFGKACEQKA